MNTTSLQVGKVHTIETLESGTSAGSVERRYREPVEKQQCCEAGEVKIFTPASGSMKSQVCPGNIDHVVNDEAAVAKEIKRRAAPGKEASSWAN
jgi:hypothetical protein